jgi:PAS domain S-box-containing protein
MDDSDSSVAPLSVLFVDPDGRLGAMASALDVHPEPVVTRRAESVPAAGALAAEHRTDCVVLLDAPATGDRPAVDGLEMVTAVRSQLPGTPIAIHSILGEHETVRRAHDRDIQIISASADETELVYRQLCSVAGVERHAKTDAEILRSLMEHYPHQLYLKDDVGRFEVVSNGTAAEHDLDREHMVSLSDFDVLDAYGEQTHEREQELLETGERIVEEIDHWLDDDGRNWWTAVTKVPRYDADGTPVGTVGSSRDITTEKRKEQMVRELHTVGRELVRAQSKADIGRAIMGMTTDIPVFSHVQVVLRTDGTRDPDPLENDSGAETLFDRHEEWFRAVLDTGAPQYVTAGGEAVNDPRWTADLEAAILPLGDHGALGVAADTGPFTDFGIDLANILAANLEAALDRSERERELQRQNERLEEFAGIVSHDLRNPLNVASGATELLAEEHDSANVDRVRDALDRMDDLIETLLTLARKGQVVGDAETVEVATAARDAWRVVDAPTATMTVAGDAAVAADRERLVELFENLFRNAVEHGSTGNQRESDDAVEHGSTSSRTGSDDAVEHGSTGNQRESDDAVEHGDETITVEVGVREAGDGFYVADDGAGIDAADDRLFEMGYSGSDGTGYGLYIVSTIAESHGWTITAGESEDSGARFDVAGVGIESAPE